MRQQTTELFFGPLRRNRFPGGTVLAALLFAVPCLFVPHRASCQDVESASGPVASDQNVASTASSSAAYATLITPPENTSRSSPESEIVVEGLASYGHYRIFASGSDCHLYTTGLEYDRHSWGRFLGARLDYSAEFLPVILLDTATSSDIWGGPATSSRKIVYGIGVSPIGFRMMWMDKRALKPYMFAKGGVLSFTEKELSNKSTYENFTLQTGFGLQARMTERVDLRFGLFSDFHFSNAFITPVDPGLDVMSANFGVSYHLGQRSTR